MVAAKPCSSIVFLLTHLLLAAPSVACQPLEPWGVGAPRSGETEVPLNTSIWMETARSLSELSLRSERGETVPYSLHTLTQESWPLVELRPTDELQPHTLYRLYQGMRLAREFTTGDARDLTPPPRPAVRRNAAPQGELIEYPCGGGLQCGGKTLTVFHDGVLLLAQPIGVEGLRPIAQASFASRRFTGHGFCLAGDPPADMGWTPQHLDPRQARGWQFESVDIAGNVSGTTVSNVLDSPDSGWGLGDLHSPVPRTLRRYVRSQARGRALDEVASHPFHLAVITVLLWAWRRRRTGAPRQVAED